MDSEALRKIIQRTVNRHGAKALRKPQVIADLDAVEAIGPETKATPLRKVADHKALEAIQRTLSQERIEQAKREYVPKAQAKVPGRRPKARL